MLSLLGARCDLRPFDFVDFVGFGSKMAVCSDTESRCPLRCVVSRIRRWDVALCVRLGSLSCKFTSFGACLEVSK